MATAMRGEVALDLDGRTVLLRPSFRALLDAEAELGSLFQVLERAGKGDPRLADIGALFWHCAIPAEADRACFEAALMEAGVGRLLEPYKKLLRAVFGQA